ncbi:hypothetical protein CYMTET_45147 [Cymbomonas tetramitiformis]|uniref:EF-hand domain-containing protein n=1 Tax=Cymbomonas tetramitiformis TaxID=36881 RepID=A0AAE0EZZ4_9CHLO|nr:hypothetical protein CYMTET_45147 [Cymbomonas tetramitiformis]
MWSARVGGGSEYIKRRRDQCTTVISLSSHLSLRAISTRSYRPRTNRNSSSVLGHGLTRKIIKLNLRQPGVPQRCFDVIRVAAGSPAASEKVENSRIQTFEESDVNADFNPPLLKAVTGDPELPLRYLYDGGCSVCNGFVKMLKGRKGVENIYFEDISSSAYDPRKNKDVQFADAMATIHVIRNEDDTILTGMEALKSLYSAVGLGWVFQLSQLPVVSLAAQLLYKFVSKYRIQLGGTMDGLQAFNRADMEKRGEGSCTDPEGECREKPMPEEQSAESVDGNGNSMELATPAADRHHLLGIYTIQKGKGLRAAPIDVDTGAMISSGATIPVESMSREDVAQAVRDLDKHFQWNGSIGIGLPGLIQDHALGQTDEKQGSKWANLKNSREDRLVHERELSDAVGRDVVIMTGAEANGFGEMAYGAGRGEKGLVMMCTVGRGFGVALFDDGVLVRNVDFSWMWTWDMNVWKDSQLPEEDEENEERWLRWGERVASYLLELEENLHPDVIILGGAASLSYPRWSDQLGEVKAPIKLAQLGPLAGVKGSAAGGALLLKLRDDQLKVRAALGNMEGVSPEKMSEEQLQHVFNAFDKDEDAALSLQELADAVRALGVKLTQAESKELMIDLDVENTGDISFNEFSSWWHDLVRRDAVELLHTEAQFDQVLEEESQSERLVVVEVKFTFCRPCKAFDPYYRECAEKFTDARFLQLVGNENKDMVHLGKHVLKIKSSPTFIFFRGGKEVHRHTGAKRDKFMDMRPHEPQPEVVGAVKMHFLTMKESTYFGGLRCHEGAGGVYIPCRTKIQAPHIYRLIRRLGNLLLETRAQNKSSA